MFNSFAGDGLGRKTPGQGVSFCFLYREQEENIGLEKRGWWRRE